MEQFKKIAKALLFPHPVVTVLLVIAAAVGLGWTFGTGNENAWYAYAVYVLSFWALVTACTSLIPAWIRMSRARRQRIASGPKLSPEKQLRGKLYRALTINWIYGGFQIVTGILCGSVWLWTNGIYNMALALIRFVLVLYERKLVHTNSETQQLRLSWNSYRITGFLLLILNLTMTGIAFQIIWNGEGSSYPELVVYAVAAFTFYRLTIAIINVVRSRKNTSPILAATRNLDLTVALMSLFSLQTAMFSAFGNDFAHQHLMNSLTGGGVCLIVVCSAVAMVFHGRKMKKSILGGKENG